VEVKWAVEIAEKEYRDSNGGATCLFYTFNLDPQKVNFSGSKLIVSTLYNAI